MPGSLVPGSNVVLENNTLASIIAAVTYGIAIVLYMISVLALLNSGSKYSKKKKNLLLVYITLMFLTSTTAYISSTLYLVQTLFNVKLLKGRVRLTDPAWIYPLSILGADAFMVMRCIALYRGMSARIRLTLIFTCGLSFLLVLGLEWFKFILPKRFTQAEAILGFAFLSFSLFANVTLSTLISLRILYFQRYNHIVLRIAQGSVYTRIIVMCVESCAMIVIFEVAYIVLYTMPPNHGADRGSMIPLLLLPHVCAISSLLIIYRVAKGKDVATQIDLSPEIVEVERGHPTIGIHFAPSESTQTVQEA
ncbi:hypothetical protein CPB84DRAFT_654982 [Gymnopilus junonius]|uniref:Uncharacterized protein n=1 Tax=Gymnopilus junonius TaxID=109634 RepID=A0A9P5NQ45_GYMJU|nr:hypothetical protein CPB84DRAFT_654982 [Gymnopilus junonius]